MHASLVASKYKHFGKAFGNAALRDIGKWFKVVLRVLQASIELMSRQQSSLEPELWLALKSEKAKAPKKHILATRKVQFVNDRN